MDGLDEAFGSQGHIATGSLRVEEPVDISWSRFSTVNPLGHRQVPWPRFEPTPSEVEGDNSNHETTAPPPPPPRSINYSIFGIWKICVWILVVFD